MRPHKPIEVTRLLLDDVEAGTYAIGDTMPTLDQLNDQYFGHRGPKPGRDAYAPLIAAGMVEARQGRYGGHILVRTTPADVTEKAILAPIAEPLGAIAGHLATLSATELTVVEFYDLTTGEYFGACLHASRLAAEQFAIVILTRLGESLPQVTTTVREASYAASDLNNYAVRIHGLTLAGARTFNDDYTAVNTTYRPDNAERNAGDK